MGNCCADDKGGVTQPGAQKKEISNSKAEDAVNAIFDKYDKDKSGLLEKHELAEVINASLAQMEGGRKAKPEEIDELLRKSDTSKDGKISRDELMVLFKKISKK